ncbi:MAG: CoA transferase [Rhodospirillaceae bacterium]|nr:CoA transferase [Rhodospirillaceae bacterium]MDE0617175.1 CoA transferase [Rhodospirillaceae bacterium]
MSTTNDPAPASKPAAAAGPAGTGLPLEGVRILDLTTIVYGPYATQTLGDFGAEIVKVEAPGGDAMREMGPGRSPHMAALFLGMNRNKKSIVLDLKRGAAREALWRLVDSADVFVHNIRPQKILKLGFDPDAVMARNPGIVYAGLYGYRDGGPYAGQPAYDDVIQGQSGLAGTFLARDGTPNLIPTIVADKISGLLAANGMLAALLQRRKTGRGVYVETAMFEGVASFTLAEHQYGAIFSPPMTPPGYPRVLSPHRRPQPTADGFICLLAYTDAQWDRFWDLVGRPEMKDDPRFLTVNTRLNHVDSLYGESGRDLVKKSSAEWLDLLRRTEIPCGPVNTLEDLRTDPHLSATGFFRPFEHPTEGKMEIPDTAFRFDGAALPVRLGQPHLGEHTETLLAEAGFDAAEVAEITGA